MAVAKKIMSKIVWEDYMKNGVRMKHPNIPFEIAIDSLSSKELNKLLCLEHLELFLMIDTTTE